MVTKVRIYRNTATVGWRKAIVSVVVVFFLTVSSSFVPSLPSWHGGGGVLFERMGRMEGSFGTVVQQPPSTGAVAVEITWAMTR